MSALFARGSTPTILATMCACAEPDRIREIGLLNGLPERTATIDTPSSVSAGTAFVVTVTTFGSLTLFAGGMPITRRKELRLSNKRMQLADASGLRNVG